MRAKAKDEIEWSFDHANALEIESTHEKCYTDTWMENATLDLYPYILGFHPYKEVVFLHLLNGRAVA